MTQNQLFLNFQIQFCFFYYFARIQVQYWKCNYAFVIHHVFATTESAASKALGLRRSKGQQTLEMNSCIIIAATSESARNERDNMHSRICKVDLFAHYIKTPIFVQKLTLGKTFQLINLNFCAKIQQYCSCSISGAISRQLKGCVIW